MKIHLDVTILSFFPTTFHTSHSSFNLPVTTQDNMSTVDDLVLDDSKLQASASAERGDLFLLTFLSNAERAVESLPEVC